MLPMISFAQNKEDLFIDAYFNNEKGTLLEIGANNGVDLSNSRLFISKGWKAHLIEPASVFYDLKRLYTDNRKVQCYNLAIGDKQEMVTLYESGAHVHGGTDKALVSTLSESETTRWRNSGVHFDEIKVNVVPFNFFWEMTDFSWFDFISIDAEGYDWLILQQIDLSAVGCRCLIIEHNGDEKLKSQYVTYCKQFGLRQALVNAENIIFIKK